MKLRVRRYADLWVVQRRYSGCWMHLNNHHTLQEALGWACLYGVGHGGVLSLRKKKGNRFLLRVRIKDGS